MEFVLHRPGPPLDRLVESITYFVDARPVYHRDKLIPDGAMQLIVDLGEAPKKLYDGDVAPGFVDFRRAWISGMQLKPIVFEAQQEASLLVIRFQAGGGYPVLGHAAEAITGSVFGLDLVLAGRRVHALRDRVLEAPTGLAKVAAAESWILEQAGRAVPPAAIVHMAARLGTGRTRVADLVAETGYSERQMLNLFRRWIGVTPKQYARLSRFQHVLHALARASIPDLELTGVPLPRPDWAMVAADLCFSDQSHLSHEFADFAGMTPTAYLSAYRGLENYLPITLE